MEVFNVGLDMEVSLAGTVIYYQPAQGFHGVLHPLKGVAQPAALLFLLQVDAPRFVHDRVHNDAWVVPIARENFPEHLFATECRSHREVIAREPAVTP